MLERGKDNCLPDEVVFIAVLERSITIFERAKELIAKKRFTVQYKGPDYNDNPQVTDFEIVPIKE